MPLDAPDVAEPLLVEPAVALPLSTPPLVAEPLVAEPLDPALALPLPTAPLVEEPLEIEPLAPDDAPAIEPVEDAPLEPLAMVEPEEPFTGATDPPQAAPAPAAIGTHSTKLRIPASCNDLMALGAATGVPRPIRILYAILALVFVPLCAKAARFVMGDAERPSAWELMGWRALESTRAIDTQRAQVFGTQCRSWRLADAHVRRTVCP